MIRVEMAPEWRQDVLLSTDEWFGDYLGPEVRDSAREHAPVRQGYLRDGIRDFIEDHTLVVWASSVEGGADREYAAFVELGHVNVAWGKWPPHANGNDYVKAEPFLRPGLYEVRSP